MLTYRLAGLLLSLILAIPAAATAQSADDALVWIQIEARPNLRLAQERAQDYAQQLSDVDGFALGSGWYAIALGPYQREDAQALLSSLRAEGRIPSDSYLETANRFRQQFWPIGENALEQVSVNTLADPGLNAPSATDLTPRNDAEADAPETPISSVAAEPDETPGEARRSERQLSRDQREALQIAMQWAGTYDGSIDGAFGPATRRSMGQWQAEQGYEVTGVLTTQQRAKLLRDYNAVLDGLGLAAVVDEVAGIEIMLPTNVLEFEKYEYPFAHYRASGDIPAQLLLISQDGNEATLAGLYSIMQTLEIVPPDGPRALSRNQFALIGESAQQISETRVRLENGQVKGFTLIWPAGDEDRRKRLIAQMDQSLVRLGNTIPVDAGASEEQSVDLISGLEIRKPRLTRSGFFVSSDGYVVTSADVTGACTRLTIDESVDAEILAQEGGLALLQPASQLAPAHFAQFSQELPRLQEEVALSGYSFEGVLEAPSMTFGALGDVRGLDGNEDVIRLSLTALAGDAGGPVLDMSGGLIGMLMPRDEGPRRLPEGVELALDQNHISAFLAQHDVRAQLSQESEPLHPFDLTNQAKAMTALVECWD